MWSDDGGTAPWPAIVAPLLCRGAGVALPPIPVDRNVHGTPCAACNRRGEARVHSLLSGGPAGPGAGALAVAGRTGGARRGWASSCREDQRVRFG